MPAPVHIPLDRRFLAAGSVESDEARHYRELAGLDGGDLGWDAVLKHRRVVILAEGGSGKTTEFEEQARRLRAAGEHAFEATVENVGRAGLAGALNAVKTGFEAWRASDRPAWFFLDSVDEARAVHVSLSTALKAAAIGIEGAEGRAHLVISARPSDWQARGDLALLEQVLPLPPSSVVLPEVDADVALTRFVRNERPPDPPPPPEVPLQLMMRELDSDRVRRYALGCGIGDASALLHAIEEADLWSFAARPLDLGWLIEEWQEQGEFAPLAQTLERSLRTRLRETGPERARSDGLNADRALEALERIGAALVLQKLDYIEVPDAQPNYGEHRRGLDLAALLPEWSGNDLTQLINRAAFNPVVPGLLRLHNDNFRTVRSYLAARWLHRQRRAHCPYSVVRRLLFADTYGEQLIVPSMEETAAWLSLQDAGVRQEVMQRQPKLLMRAGDPASLPAELRQRILREAIAAGGGARDMTPGSFEQLKRLARPDLAPVVRELWSEHSERAEVRRLLLMLIHFGRLPGCQAIAERATFESWPDRTTRVWGARAWMAIATPEGSKRYASYVLANVEALEGLMIWDAVEELFPAALSIGELAQLLGRVSFASNHDWQFESLSKKLPARLSQASDLEPLVQACLDRLIAHRDESDEDENALDTDGPFVTAIEAFTLRWFELLDTGETSTTAMQAVCALRKKEWGAAKHQVLLAAATASGARRRALMWFAREWLGDGGMLPFPHARELWHFDTLGVPLNLQAVDAAWLLDDARHRPDAAQRALAADALLRLREQFSLGDELVERLRELGTRLPEVREVLDGWNRQPELTEAQRQRHERARSLQEQRAAEVANTESGWKALAERVRANSARFRALDPPKPTSMDGALNSVNELLLRARSDRGRYGVSSLDALAPFFKADVRASLTEGFIGFWRHWKPILESDRSPMERHRIHSFDRVGIVGVSLEAARSPRWAESLAPDEAVRAAQYATLELNGLGRWVSALAQAHPTAVRDVLTGELAKVHEDPTLDVAHMLQRIAHEGREVKRLVAPYLFEQLRIRAPQAALIHRHAMRIVQEGLERHEEWITYLSGRLSATPVSDDEFLPVFLGLFGVAPQRAYEVLDKAMSVLAAGEQTAVMKRVLRGIGGGVFSSEAKENLAHVPLQTLRDLISLAYRTVPMVDDGETAIDDTQSARSALFGALVETPGYATYAALQGFRKDGSLGIDVRQLRRLARDRAATDSEHEPWRAKDVAAFEQDYLTVPRSAAELHRVVSARIDDLAHDLVNAPYGAGRDLIRGKREIDAQILVSGVLWARKGRSYSFEREAHVADEKEPDIRFEAKGSDATMPLEIKVVNEWTYQDLVDALHVQLIGRYMRAREERHGVLLLIYKRRRKKGWRSPDGTWLKFDQLVEALRREAASAAQSGPQAPQVSIDVIDVSGISMARDERPAGRSKKTRKKVSGRKTRASHAKAKRKKRKAKRNQPPKAGRAASRASRKGSGRRRTR